MWRVGFNDRILEALFQAVVKGVLKYTHFLQFCNKMKNNISSFLMLVSKDESKTDTFDEA